MNIFIFVFIGSVIIICFLWIILYIFNRFVCSIRNYNHRKLIEFLDDDDTFDL